MATSSFFEPLVIKTDEEAEALIEAYEAARNQKPIKRIDILSELERGRSFLREIYSR
jgi:hypothetical protein